MSLVNRRSPRGVGALFLGWWVVAGGWVIQVLNGGLLFQAFGTYFVHLQAEFGWSRTVLAGSFSLTRVESGFLGPLQGWLIDRFGARAVIRVGLVVFGIGFMLFSLINSVFTFYAAFLLITIGSSLGGWLTVNVAVASWFRRKRGMAMGLVATGLGVGGLLVPAVAWTLNTYGWRATAFGSGVLIMVLALPLSQLIRNRPEQYGLVPDGAPPRTETRLSSGRVAPVQPAAKRDDASTDFTAREALRTPAFWLIGLGHASAVLVVSAVNVHLIPHLVQRLGMSLELASVIFAVMTVLTIMGQVGGGLLADRVEKRLLAVLAMLGHALGILVLAFATSVAGVLTFAVLHGLAWGVRNPVMGSMRADYFGTRFFGSIMGFSSLVVMLGAITGPLLAGFLADRTGDYRLGFTILAALAGAGTLFFALARKPTPPHPAETASLTGTVPK